jgi:hypothetical protein
MRTLAIALLLLGCGGSNDEPAPSDNDSASVDDTMLADSVVSDSTSPPDGTTDSVTAMDTSVGGCGAIATWVDTATFARVLDVKAGGMYATIDAALKAAKAGDKVVIHAGTYPGGTYASNLQGTATQPIMITGAPGEAKPHIQGGAEGLHLTDPSYVVVQDLEISGQTSNAMNVDDGATAATPAHHLVFRGLMIHDVASGNHDGLKMSGVDDAFVLDSEFEKIGGQMVDMVGCHRVTVARSKFKTGESVGVQMKGGSSDDVVTRNWFESSGQRGVNMGGSTGLEFFRPIDAKFEAARITVTANVFIGHDAPFAYVGCDECVAANNTILRPLRWATRILQETVDPARFVPSRKGRFVNNIVVVATGISGETVNVGANTEPSSFVFSNNLWFHTSNPTFKPTLPVMETAGVYGDPKLAGMSDPHLTAGSPAAGKGIDVMVPADYDGKCWKTPRAVGALESP